MNQPNATVMKTARITFLATPDFKQYLAAQASGDGISIGELIRSRCLLPQKGTDEKNLELELRTLTIELQRSIVEARNSLQEGLEAAAAAMNTIRRQAYKDIDQRKVA